MGWRTSVDSIAQYCSEGGFCEYCKLYDTEKKACVFKEIPALWDIHKIKQACIEAGISKEVE